jgi:hypothetical protein
MSACLSAIDEAAVYLRLVPLWRARLAKNRAAGVLLPPCCLFPLIGRCA